VPGDTKTFHDGLGRVTYQSENHTDFTPPDTNTGGTDKSQDRVTEWRYNGLDRVTQLIAKNQTGTTDDQSTTYTYSGTVDASWVTHVRYPDTDGGSQDQVIYAYDLQGKTTSRTDQRGTKIDYLYTSDTQLLEWDRVSILGTGVDNHVLSIRRFYDTQQRVYRIRSNSTLDEGAGNFIRNEIYMTFDETLAPKQVYQSQEGAYSAGSTPYVQYDRELTPTGGMYINLARLNQVRYPSGRFLRMEFGSANSIADRLSRISRLKGNLKDNSSDSNYVTYDYLGGGRPARILYEAPQVEALLGVDVSPDYEFLDRFGRVTTRDWRRLGTPRDQVFYTYDFAGNRLSRDIPASLYATNDQDQAYTYDGGHRLLHVDQGTWNGSTITSKKFAQDWVLDALGNWDNSVSPFYAFKQDNNGDGTYELNQTRTHNKANETLTASSWASPLHDAAGNMTTVPQPGTPASSYALKYDAWNRLVQVNTGSIATYEYDGLGRRIAKVSSSVTEDYYYNDAYQIIEVRRGGVMREQLVWNVDYIDSLAVRFNDFHNGAGGAADGDFLDTNEQHYALQDGNYNVTALADAAGAVFERYRYTPYGERKVLEPNFTDDGDNISDVGNPYTYTGRQLDGETGLYYYRARCYHAQLGRFVSRDPIMYRAGDLNLYRYVLNAVLHMLDPFGLDDWDQDGKDDDLQGTSHALPPPPPPFGSWDEYIDWYRGLPQDKKDEWDQLQRILNDDRRAFIPAEPDSATLFIDGLAFLFMGPGGTAIRASRLGRCPKMAPK
jgi:RHS repeat-associated protein